MEIKKFYQMSLDDRADYASVLFGEAVKYLWRQGRMEDANQVKALFTKASAEDVSKGMSEFVGVLNGLSDLEKQGQLPQVPHVEQAMFIVFKRHGVTIPMQDLMQFAQDFKPSGGVIDQSGGVSSP